MRSISPLLLLAVLLIVSFYGCAPDADPAPTLDNIAGSHPVAALKPDDFKPVSHYQMSDTQIDKAPYLAIDLHAHSYVDAEAKLDEWVQTMDDIDLEKSVITTTESSPEP